MITTERQIILRIILYAFNNHITMLSVEVNFFLVSVNFEKTLFILIWNSLVWNGNVFGTLFWIT